MAQPFSLRYPLVDGQGNFGSIDDDPPAAMRYTEARLSRMATEMLRDQADADTVDFAPNYDESRREPTVLPSRFLNLLVNGSAGIAVGMATNMPPHRLSEIVDAIVQLIDKPDSNDDLMKHVKGPDFPTGAIVLGRQGIRDAYRTGRGRIVMRARAHIEELRGGKSAIIVTELPYGTKKGGESGVIKKIADLVGQGDHRDPTSPTTPTDRDAGPDRAEARGDPAGGVEQALQAHLAAGDLGYNAVALVDNVLEDALAARADHVLPRLPARDRDPPLEVRAAQGRGSRARPRRLPDRARQPRRGDPGDRAALDTDAARQELMAVLVLRDPGDRDPRPPPARSHRARAKRVEDEFADLQERITELRAILGDPAQGGRIDPRGAARASRRCTARRTTAAPRSSPPRESSRSRT